MAKRTYEQRLLDTLLQMPEGQWFRIDNREDVGKLTEAVKIFINIGFNFEFSSDYSKVRRLIGF